MPSLNVNFAGLQLRNPVIVASAPPTENLESIIKCAEAGAGAIVTKSAANFDSSRFQMGARRTYVDKSGLWAQGTFRHETLTLDEGVKLVEQSVRSIDVPVIASVGSLSLEPQDWITSCLAMQDAGASMVQLDLFYLPQPRCSANNMQKLCELLRELTTQLRIPVAPKLNYDIPPHLAAQFLKDTSIDAVFLIDSIRVPVPIDINQGGRSKIQHLEGARECSLFGAWQKPLTLQYTSVIHDTLSIPISAGGGFMNGKDAIEAMMLGATTVQFATVIIRYGHKQITKILKQLHLYMEKNHIETLDEIRGAAQRITAKAAYQEGIFTPARAVVDHDLCIKCGLCTRIVFCEDISLGLDGKVEIKEACDGCGLCPTTCPIPGALQVFPL